MNEGILMFVTLMASQMRRADWFWHGGCCEFWLGSSNACSRFQTIAVYGH